MPTLPIHMLQQKSPWSIKEFVEPKAGEIHRIYSFKGKVCKRIVLDSPMAKQLAGYVLIEKDIRSAQGWLSHIDEIRGDDAAQDKNGSRSSPDRERYNLVKGLFVAALTFYGKAFAQADGRRVKLERRQVSEEFREVHDLAIAFRNNFAAHSGAKLIEKAEIAIALPTSNRKATPNLYTELEQPDYALLGEGEKSFANLFEHVHFIPQTKIRELKHKIFVEEVLPKGYDYWAKKKKI
ncbi:hypothetical protein [Herminiimonas contaminans]|uniref:Uncharacterized protein n=1 Tax=Herminiimonas contaminans TaxID=1111140 RepID=A0ABS0ETG6_9BURK|nr:hypothetical protein [Herminiimonas contaminans]MBF8178039.1 hypothetical protein [Herminiimonas contaminans]